MVRKAMLLMAMMIVAIPAAYATPISNTSGLLSPGATITFDELVFAGGTSLTVEYAGFGVAFSPFLRYDSQDVSGCCNGITGHYVGNNGGEIVNPFDLFFTTDQTAVAFAVATNPAETTFTASLDGAFVESFSSPTNFNNSTPFFFGFTGITFDQIQVTVGGDTQALIDNIQLGTAVPEPTTLLLLGSGLVGLVVIRRRRGYPK